MTKTLWEASVEDSQSCARPDRSERFVLTVVLLLASLLRLGWVGTTEFKLDEAALLNLAVDAAQGRSLTLIGTGTSFGMPTAPWSAYLYALPSTLWAHPLWATWCTGALNVLAVAACWWITRRYWGARSALVASALYASAPWAALFSRKIWEPNLLPPLALAMVASGLLGFVEGRPKFQALHLLLLAIAVQVHFSALALVPVSAWVILAHRRTLRAQAVWAGAGLGLLTFVPFAVYVTRHLGNLSGAWASLAQSPGGSDLPGWRFWWIVTTGANLQSLTGSSGSQEYARRALNLGVVHACTGIAILAGLTLWMTQLVRDSRRRAHQAGAVLGLWALSPVLLSLWLLRTVHIHYYIAALPAPFIAAGCAIDRAAERLRPKLQWIVPCAVSAGAVVQATALVGLLTFVRSHATEGGFGVPLAVQMQAVGAARKANLPIVAAVPGHPPATGEWGWVLREWLRGTSYRLIDGQQMALFPSAPAILIIAPGCTEAVELYTEMAILSSSSEVPGRSGEEPFRVAAMPGSLHQNLVPAGEPSKLANGVQILGYSVAGEVRPDQRFHLRIGYRILDESRDRQKAYQLFRHLVDGRGKRYAQFDGPTAPTAVWAAGDTYLQCAEMSVPVEAAAGDLYVRVGMYTYPDLQNQPVLDAALSPVGQYVTLGPVARR